MAFFVSAPHFQTYSASSKTDLPIDPEEIKRPKDPKRKRSSMGAFFSGDQNRPSGSNVPRPLPRRPDIAPREKGAHGYPHHSFLSIAGSSTSLQRWNTSFTLSGPSFAASHSSRSFANVISSQYSHRGPPPTLPIAETVKPPNSIVEEREPDQKFNITGFVKGIQRVEKTTSSNIFKGTYSFATVAVKSLRNPGIIPSQAIRRRFHREVIVWCSLDHPNILPLFGYTEDNSDFGALVSPWYNDGDMAKVLGAGTHQLSLEKRMELVNQVTSALVYLHGLHPVIVHGDLKPGNILLDDRQQAQLCDFGISRLISGVSTVPLRTIRYIAPERLYNSDPYTVPTFPSTESDVYALASIAYEFIYLQSPYHQHAHPQEIFRAISRDEPPAVRTTLHHLDPFAAVENYFWDLLDQSWSRSPPARPVAIQFRDAFAQIMRIYKRNIPADVLYPAVIQA